MRKYFNPVHGKRGVFGGEYPEFLTKDELIAYASESAIGESYGIQESFNSFLEWIQEGGVDFRYEDLTIEELGIVDEIVFICDGCGWNCSTDEKNDENGNAFCSQCIEDYNTEEEDEDEE